MAADGSACDQAGGIDAGAHAAVAFCSPSAPDASTITQRYSVAATRAASVTAITPDASDVCAVFVTTLLPVATA